MAGVLAFDVNETLLDLRALDPLFTDLFGDAGLRPQWFATMLQLSFVGGLTGQYVDFSTAQRAALRMVAARSGRDITTGSIETVLDAMRRLPAHPDVKPALTRLRDAGERPIALTNSVLDVARAQLSNAGLTDLFEDIFSADEVRALKPFAAPYLMVAERCGVDIDELWMVAAHDWDVSGAMGAGAQAAFVARGGGVPSPLGSQPAVVGADLTEVVDALLTDRQSSE
ncbi:haloacid dehalogenase type II [Mycolicibacterium sphagni]|uniref:Haloacid dehalogenase, type II n=1 Tax=Mycolicibacterium sphagni TaxID=1786 RepID=A0A255DJR6_9MYCO|nr:haloacid dehalogenase type II [Mycolicibacterium sphagni]OYN77485.1 haloacid dehalogenase, type II [Mycolicibacterium sphagni]